MWVSWVIGGLALVLGFIYFVKSRKFKRLTYATTTRPAFQPQGDSISLELFYDGGRVVEPAVTIFSIRSTGTVPIEPTDFQRDLTVVFEGVDSILSAETAGTTPHDLSPEFQKYGTRLTLSPLLLNCGDRFDLRFVTDGEPTGIVVSSRIAGISEIKRVEFYDDPHYQPNILGLTRWALALMSTVAVAMVWITPSAPTTGDRIFTTTVLSMMVILAFLGSPLSKWLNRQFRR